MEEQRQRVMQNKRRMSFLAKERINNMNNKLGGRNNMNTATAAFGKKKKRKIGSKTKNKKNANDDHQKNK